MIDGAKRKEKNIKARQHETSPERLNCQLEDSRRTEIARQNETSPERLNRQLEDGISRQQPAFHPCVSRSRCPRQGSHLTHGPLQ